MYFGRPRLATREALKQARIARLRDSAPTLTKTRKSYSTAMIGALLALLAVAGFYYAVNIYQAVLYARPGDSGGYVQVDVIPEIKPSLIEEALSKIEA